MRPFRSSLLAFHYDTHLALSLRHGQRRKGHFTVVEIILTLLIGASSILGIVAVIRDRTHVKFRISVSVFVLFSALQVVAMWISFKRPFVNI